MYQLSTTIFKTYYTEVQEIRINTDNSLIFSNNDQTKSYKFSNTRESVDLRTNHIFPGTFSQMIFITTGNTQIHTRSYKKLFDILYQIGGFFNSILNISYVLNFFYSKNMIIWHCVSSLLTKNDAEEHLEKDEELKKKKPFTIEENFKRDIKPNQERVKVDNFVKENNSRVNGEKNEEDNSGSNFQNKAQNISEEMHQMRRRNNNSINEGQ